MIMVADEVGLSCNNFSCNWLVLSGDSATRFNKFESSGFCFLSKAKFLVETLMFMAIPGLRQGLEVSNLEEIAFKPMGTGKLRIAIAGICCEFLRKRIVIKSVPLQIPGIVLIAPKVFCQRRSFFYESYNQGKSEGAVGRKNQFAQHGFASSIKNILCGLSYQLQKS